MKSAFFLAQLAVSSLLFIRILQLYDPFVFFCLCFFLWLISFQGGRPYSLLSTELFLLRNVFITLHHSAKVFTERQFLSEGLVIV